MKWLSASVYKAASAMANNRMGFSTLLIIGFVYSHQSNPGVSRKSFLISMSRFDVVVSDEYE